MSRMLDHLICGSTFGALHAAASSISGCRLIGVLGKGSSRTSSLAAAYGVPSITDINEVPRTSGGVASVALRSPSLGGDSVEVALSLAERGWNVLVEGPLSKNDITMIGKGCRKTRTSFMVANHYLNLPSTHAFKKAAKSFCLSTSEAAISKFAPQARSCSMRFPQRLNYPSEGSYAQKGQSLMQAATA